jgi:tetratricopeptide (TPR) repeat protein
MQEIVERNPKDADAWYSLGFFAVNQQDLDTAEHAFKQVVQLLEPIGVYGAPGRSPPRLVLGDIFAAKQQLDDARAMYRVFFERAARDDIYAHKSYRRAALILLHSPDLDDFILGLRTLSASPQVAPENAWLDTFAGLSLSPEWKAAALQVLDHQRDSNLLDDRRRARILSALGVEDTSAMNGN